MGDIVTLVEQAEERLDRDEAERSSATDEARFTLEDFRSQLQQVEVGTHRSGPPDGARRCWASR